MIANLTRADGQVAATAGQIVSWVGSESYRFNLTFQNTGGSSETLVITLARASGTARRVARAVLATNEQLVIAGLSVDGDDVLYAVTTNASVVDYTASIASDNAAFAMAVYDANGAVKQILNSGNAAVAGTLTVTGASTLTGDVALGGAISIGTTVTAAAGVSTAAAGTTTADAGVLPAGTASVYPTTAADGTKGVRIHASDKVTGREFFVGNGVSTAILKVYAPSGGTINGAAADAAFSSVSGKGVWLYCLSGSGNTWLAS